MKPIIKYSILVILALTALSFAAPVGVYIALGGGTRDTVLAKGSMRIDSVAVFRKYRTADTNKVLGITSYGTLVLRTKSAADSSVYATRYYVQNNFPPNARTITSGWNSIAYGLSSNVVLIAPTLQKVTDIDSATTHAINFTKGFYVNKVDGTGILLKYAGTTLFKADSDCSNTGFWFNGSGQFITKVLFTATAVRTDTVQDGSGTFAFTKQLPILRTGVITGNGLLTTFNITAPSSGTLCMAQSASTLCVVADASMSGATITIHTVSAPAIGSFNITYWYQ